MDKVISLKDRIETVKNQKTSKNIKSICLTLAADAERYKRIIIICETLEGDLCTSWIGMDTGNTILNMFEGFLHKFVEVVNSTSKQMCSKCGSEMYYHPPTILRHSWNCSSPKCNKP